MKRLLQPFLVLITLVLAAPALADCVLRQSTASQEIPLGPFVDSTDGVTAETGLTIANTDIKLQKGGATSQASKNSGGATHIATGDYYAVLDATDTDTVGNLRVKVAVSGALPVWLDCLVFEEAVFDALYAASAPGYVANAPVNVVQFGGTAGTFASGRAEVNASHAGGTAWGSGAITAGSIATDAIGAAELNADVGTELLTGLSGLAVNATQISGDSTAADNLETAYDDTAGAVRWEGVVDQGTAQAATATTLQLRSAAAFANDEIIGATCVITGGSAGVGQARSVTAYVSSTDTATVATWTTTPSGTITYRCYGTAAGSGGGGLDAAGVRAAVGLASANLDTQLSTIDTVVDAILVDTGTTLDDLVDDLESRLGTPSNLGGGATVAANLSDIEGQTDDIGSAGAGLTAADDAVMTRLGAPAGASIAADIATVDDFVDTEVAAILDDTGTSGVVVAAGSKTGYALSAAGVDAIWDEPQSGHATADTFGAYLDSAISGVSTGGISAGEIADAVWDEATTGHATAGTFAVALTDILADTSTTLDDLVDDLESRLGTPSNLGGGATVAGNLSDIEGQTDDIGVAGVGLTAVPWNAAWDAEAQSEAADALAAYDPPTHAELTAALAALNDIAASDVRDVVIEDQGGGISLGCAISVILAYAAGDLVTSSGNSTYEDPSGTETRATGTVASSGNRTASVTCPSY